MYKLLAAVALFITTIVIPQQVRIPGPGGAGSAGGGGGGTPTLAQYIGKSGIDLNRNGSGTAVNANIFNFDSVGPRVLPSGALIVMTTEWPNNPTTGNNYHATCTAPCAPTFSDNQSNSWNAVFTAGTGCKDSRGDAFDHGIYYAQGVASGTSAITETHPQLISNNVTDGWAFYNVATSGGPDGSSCLNNVTPSSNTAPNISGTALTTTANGDLIVIGIDDQGPQANAVTSLTVPSGCSLLNDASTPTQSYGMAHWTIYCIQTTAGSFTPTFTVAQSTHDTFTIYAAAFKAGAGGAAPSAGPGILLSSQELIIGNASTYTVNVGCPSGTTSLFITDDAGSISSVTDSNSNTFTGVTNTTLGAGQTETFYKLGMTTTGQPNSYTVSLHTGSSGNVDLITFYCTNTTNLDTGFTVGGGGTQVTSSTIQNSVSTSSGGGLSAYTNLPTGTPGHAGALYIENCTTGNGPALQASQPAGSVADFTGPSAIANVLGGDADDYLNGDGAGHYYQNSLTAINFGWNVQNNSSSITCMVTATY